jgi:hypothetical protein
VTLVTPGPPARQHKRPNQRDWLDTIQPWCDHRYFVGSVIVDSLAFELFISAGLLG